MSTKHTDGLESYKFIGCREVGHAWEPGGFDERPGTFGVARVLKCLRCPASRHDIYNYRGELLSRQYKYPDGYQIKGGGFTRTDFREELFRREGIRHLKPVKKQRGAA